LHDDGMLITKRHYRNHLNRDMFDGLFRCVISLVKVISQVIVQLNLFLGDAKME